MGLMSENWLKMYPLRSKSHLVTNVDFVVENDTSNWAKEQNVIAILRVKRQSYEKKYHEIYFEADDVKQLVPEFIRFIDEAARRQVLLDMLGNIEEDELIQFLAHVVKQAKKNSQSRGKSAKSNGSPRTSRQL